MSTIVAYSSNAWNQSSKLKANLLGSNHRLCTSCQISVVECSRLWCLSPSLRSCRLLFLCFLLASWVADSSCLPDTDSCLCVHSSWMPRVFICSHPFHPLPTDLLIYSHRHFDGLLPMVCIWTIEMCLSVLCGVHGEACWAKYGSYPLHRSYCHEQALRILLASIHSHAARYKRYIVPVSIVS